MLLAVRLVKDVWCVSIHLLFWSVYISQIVVQSTVCLFWCRSVVICKEQVAAGNRFSGVCSKLVNQLSRVSRCY